MILIAMGANVAGRAGGPRRTLALAAEWLDEAPLRLTALSRLWRCAPLGPDARQPVFFNAVAAVETELSPRALLRRLQALEARAGRRRGARWGPRALDLDLIDYHGRLRRPPGMGRRAQGLAAHAAQRRGLVLPHPGIARRVFVLGPLMEIAPRWRHPATGARPDQMLARLPARERAGCRPCAPFSRLRQGGFSRLTFTGV